ncbi:unnamed protein product, partial [Allacma fusca]
NLLSRELPLQAGKSGTLLTMDIMVLGTLNLAKWKESESAAGDSSLSFQTGQSPLDLLFKSCFPNQLFLNRRSIQTTSTSGSSSKFTLGKKFIRRFLFISASPHPTPGSENRSNSSIQFPYLQPPAKNSIKYPMTIENI